MKILGIDPGLAKIGWGIVEYSDSAPRAEAHGTLTTLASQSLPERLRLIQDTLSAVVAEHHPESAAVEEIFFALNVRTAILMAHGRGAAIAGLAGNDLELFEYSPLQIKQAVAGYGRASKDQVKLMVRSLLKMDHTPKSDHETDALAIALCHGMSTKRRSLVSQALEASSSGRLPPRRRRRSR